MTQLPHTIVNLLLVDDKLENLLVLEELLAQPDRKLLTATSGNAALRLLLKHEVALVLLDVEMPEMDGYETAQLMRGVESTQLVPIIFVTAGDRSEERTFRGYDVGAVDFLYKPINPHTLQSKVNVFIELYRKTRELARVNAELEHTSATLRDKVADLENVTHTLSHDLRAPVRSIRGFAQILAESLEGKLDAEAADALDRVLRAGERMGAMVDDLYRLLRLSAEETTAEDVEVAIVVDDVTENLQTDLEQAGAIITQDDVLPTVRGNRMLLTQILQNLIGNALKFRGPGVPTIHIGAVRAAGSWVLSVRDNGVGIPEEDRGRVFELFHRLSSAGAGTGVGLALCKRAVEKLGGRIWATAPAGPGTTLCFTIPDAPEPVAT